MPFPTGADGAVDTTDSVEADTAVDAHDIGVAEVSEDPPGELDDPAIDPNPIDAPADTAADTIEIVEVFEVVEDLDLASEETEPVPPPEPLRILFIGNSFTFNGPIPTIVDEIANDAGWPDPDVHYSAFGGETLHGHRDRSETLALVDEGDWNVAVLQEFSTRPTDNIGDPEQFKTDATWFHDRIRVSSPDARVILFETWARHEDHSYYPGTFSSPAEMQAQLRTHYWDAADNWIPNNAAELVEPPITVAPVGDTWEHHLAEPDPLRLHNTDDYHAGLNGRYLSGLVIYATIYERSVIGLTAWEIDIADAERLQLSANAVTGFTIPWGPPGSERVRGLRVGQQVMIDLGGTDSTEPGWNSLSDATGGTLDHMTATDLEPTTVNLVVTDDFGGVNASGLDDNTLGYPASASSDSFYCGSFDNHADGLTKPGQVTLSGLDPDGQYDISVFSSRAGDDGGRGRLTRYTIDGELQDLEVSDNTSQQAVFVDVEPDDVGRVVVDVAVSLNGTGRFCYLGVVEIERQ